MNDHIRIGDVTPRVQYVADGFQTEFSYPFPIFVQDDLEIFVNDIQNSSGYAVLGAGSSYGGLVIFDTPPVVGTVVTLRRSLAVKRMTDFQQSGAFSAKVINDELDYLTAALQQVANDVGRAVRLGTTDADANLELPSKDERANKVLGFDASGEVIATSSSGGTGGGVTDHGQLTGLGDDDHIQYHTDARGDARYYAKAQLDAALGGKSDAIHNHDAAYAPASHVADTGNPHGVTKSHLGLDNVENIKTNLSAGVDPTQNDDSNHGYTVGSRWINTASDKEFVCLDATPGAAAWVETTQTGGGGASDHGALTGLGDDDHSQYHNDARGDARYYTQSQADTRIAGKSDTGHAHVLADIADAGTAAAADTGTAVGDVPALEDVGGGTPGLPAVDGSQLTGLPSGVSDHGALTGLGDDDHTQYHTDARGDARYYTETELDAGQLDTRYYTETEVDSALSGYEPVDATLLRQADVDDTPVNGATAVPVSSNWAYDHENDTSNPHGVTAAQAGADPAGTAASAVATHEGTYDHGLIATALRPGADDANIAAAASATNYTPAAATVEGHLAGIDTAIGALGGGHDPVTVNPSDTIDLDLGGGQDLTADAKTQMSITSDASGLKLSGDSATPGNNKVYGTNGSGVKVWKDDPAGGAGAVSDTAITASLARVRPEIDVTGGQFWRLLATPRGTEYRVRPDEYTLRTVVFDGASGIKHATGNPATIIDSKEGTFETYIKFTGGNGVKQGLFSNFFRFELFKNTDNKIYVEGRNAAATLIMRLVSSTTYTDADDWLHIVISWDLTNAANRHMYINGVNVLDTVATYTNDTIEHTRVTGVGLEAAGTPVNFLTGIMERVGLWQSYMNLSDPAVMALFGAGIDLADLGDDGTLSDGTTSAAFFRGPASDFPTCRSGNHDFSFAVVGTLTDGPSNKGYWHTVGRNLYGPDGKQGRLVGFRHTPDILAIEADYRGYIDTNGVNFNHIAFEIWWAKVDPDNPGEQKPSQPGVYNQAGLVKIKNALRHMARAGLWIVPSLRVTWGDPSATAANLAADGGDWQGWANHTKTIDNDPVTVGVTNYGNYRDRFFAWTRWIMAELLADPEIAAAIAYWELWHFPWHNQYSEATNTLLDKYSDVFMPAMIALAREYEPYRLLGVSYRHQHALSRAYAQAVDINDPNLIYVTGGYGSHLLLMESPGDTSEAWPPSGTNDGPKYTSGQFEFVSWSAAQNIAFHSQEGPGLHTDKQVQPLNASVKTYLEGLGSLYNTYSHGFAWHGWDGRPTIAAGTELGDIIRSATYFGGSSLYQYQRDVVVPYARFLSHNLAATAAPGDTTDDETLGYGVGSRWIDVTADKEYVCVDATDGAAVWVETTGAGGGGSWIDAADYGLDQAASAATNDTALDNAIAYARANGLSLYIPSGIYKISQTFALSGHNMTTDAEGESGENANDMCVWFDRVVFQVDSGAIATDFHECKSYEWITDGVGESGYKSVSDLFLRTVEPWDAASEAPIVTGHIAGTSVGVKKYCIFDTRGIQGSTFLGRLHILGNFDGSNSDNIVGIGCSQRGLQGNDGQRVLWPHLIFEDIEIGLYGTPRFGQSASVAARDDGFADCFTAGYFPQIETRGNIGRALVIGPNKMDGTFIARATFEGQTATSRIHQTGAQFGSLRINHKIRNTTQYAAMEITASEVSVAGECYIRNNGSNADTKGAAYFFRVGSDANLRIGALRYDNTDLNTAYPDLIYVGGYQNGLQKCGSASVKVFGNNDLAARLDLRSIVRLETDQSSGRTRDIDIQTNLAWASAVPVSLEDTGGSSTGDVIRVKTADVNQQYQVDIGKLVFLNPNVLAKSNARTTVDNTVTLTNILSVSVPTNCVGETGGRLKATLLGDCAVNGATTAAFNFKCTFGGTTEFDVTTELFPGAGTANGRVWKLEIELVRRGATTWGTHAVLFISEDGADTSGRGTMSGFANIQGGIVARVSHSGADISAAAATLAVQVAPTVAQVGTRVRCDNYFVERM